VSGAMPGRLCTMRFTASTKMRHGHASSQKREPVYVCTQGWKCCVNSETTSFFTGAQREPPSAAKIIAKSSLSTEIVARHLHERHNKSWITIRKLLRGC
jgi:hypothetical protein